MTLFLRDGVTDPPVAWLTGCRSRVTEQVGNRETLTVFGYLQPGLTDLLCHLLREEVGGNARALPVYLTVNIRQIKALLLSPGLAVQAGLGAAAEPDQSAVTLLLPQSEGPRLTLGHLNVPTDLLVRALLTLSRLHLQTALLAHRGTLGLLESEADLVTVLPWA